MFRLSVPRAVLAAPWILLALGLYSPALADPTLFVNSTGLSGPFSEVTFDELVLADNEMVTTQFVPFGLTLSTSYANDQDGFFARNYVGNFNLDTGDLQPGLSLFFSGPVSAAAFQLATNPGDTTFIAYLGGVAVDSETTFTDGTGFYFGFSGGDFDRIDVLPEGLALEVKDVQSVVDSSPPSGVPEPAAWALLLLGFGVLGAAARAQRRGAAAG